MKRGEVRFFMIVLVRDERKGGVDKTSKANPASRDCQANPHGTNDALVAIYPATCRRIAPCLALLHVLRSGKRFLSIRQCFHGFVCCRLVFVAVCFLGFVVSFKPRFLAFIRERVFRVTFAVSRKA